MASAFIERRETKTGISWRVRYRLGGRESPLKFGGAFPTERLAKLRRDWIAGELARKAIPDLRFVETAATETLSQVAERWRRSRIDVSEGTRATHTVNLGRVLPTLGDHAPGEIRKADVADLVTSLHEQGSPESRSARRSRRCLRFSTSPRSRPTRPTVFGCRSASTSRSSRRPPTTSRPCSRPSPRPTACR